MNRPRVVNLLGSSYISVMLRQSPLHEHHRANGASFVEQDGWMLPLRFRDPLEEYRAVRSSVGVLDLCHRALLRFTGADRLSFLQGMVSNDVKQLLPGEGIQAAVLDIQGRILADVRIFCLADSLLLDLWEFRKEKIIAHLNRYLVADDVEIADWTGQYALVSLQGKAAGRLLNAILPGGEPPERDLAHRPFRIGDAEGRVVRATHTGEDGYDLFLTAGAMPDLLSRIVESGRKYSPRWVGAEALELLRVEAAIPRYGVDMGEENLLLETGLDRAVNFHKGCYLGQEVVERVRSRGHVNKKLSGLILEGDTAPERASAIRCGEKEIGRVTSSILSPARRRPLALGYLHRDYLQPGTGLTIASAGGSLAAVVSALPFYTADNALESGPTVG